MLVVERPPCSSCSPRADGALRRRRERGRRARSDPRRRGAGRRRRGHWRRRHRLGRTRVRLSRRAATRQRLHSHSRHRSPRHRARRGLRGMGQRRDRRRGGATRRTFVLVLRGPEHARRRPDPLAAVGAERWPAPIPAQLATTAAEGVLVNRILRLHALPTWTRGKVALLGDAAHAMEPNLGQGAAQTIEDAEALLVALRAGTGLSGALAAYATARRARARMFQRESSRFARLALSTHTGPRDLMMRLSPEAVRRRAVELLLRRHAQPRRALSG